ncbi:cupin domain-containing protein [Aquimarina sp. MMG016]|uniref:cupin domain-containing protein n=1 Tax=Aquimarina sp. MMG016 TaxID=2822690 RepID=UPI001B3A2766|nr:cupin domain-containing protein [Aquimarina sp. MMG016]MBQ4819345.1 cupin domain-containing protein [Aquimarina sp. MMG016]
MKIFFVCIVSFLSLCNIQAQGLLKDVNSIQPDEEFDNILVKKIYSDKNASTFVIWIKKGVKPHKHLEHTEQVHILEGKAEMILGDQKLLVKAGDWITIPEQTIHAVKVIEELKVISI